MRTKEEILEAYRPESEDYYSNYKELMLETLLDIRDLLATQVDK